jgi:hypothetical protein
MKNFINNPQERIDQVTESFDYETVVKVVKALNRQAMYTSWLEVSPDSFNDQTLKDYTTLVMNEAFTSYEQDGVTNFGMGGFIVDIRNHEDNVKVNVAYVIDEMDTY